MSNSWTDQTPHTHTSMCNQNFSFFFLSKCLWGDPWDSTWEIEKCRNIHGVRGANTKKWDEERGGGTSTEGGKPTKTNKMQASANKQQTLNEKLRRMAGREAK
mmetsp:Transcript_28456/g.60690  ORF Transcript_28456/g.60690 Transcript_28456/m.60690 type:complete len:103 (+) Transcript_28456:123-431(+)